MDIKRNILIIALAVVSYLMLLAWNKDYPAQAASPNIDTASNTVAETLDLPVAQQNNNDFPELAQTTLDAPAVAQTNSTSYISVSTPTQIVTIDLKGGDIVRLTLPKFPTALETPNDPFVLLDNTASLLYVAQSGLIGKDGPDNTTSGRPVYTASQDNYVLTESELSVDLNLSNANGVDIIKRYTFSADDYLIKVQYLITNNSATAWSGNLFGQIKRNSASDPSGGGGVGMNAYLGAVMNTPDDPYKRLDFDDIDDGEESYAMTGGWIGFSQHYFLGSWVPAAESENTYSTRKNASGEYLLGFVANETRIQPTQSATIEADFWAGPKDQYRLQEISPDLGLTIDYGKLWFVAYPIFWLLTQINDNVGNYGFSIILLTLFIRILFYPLSVKQFRSQANMKRIQPKLAQLKEKHGDDKQKFMQAQMELWKKENVNPFSGCLPPLLQMPFFLGIYWVLRESVEVRQAPFMLWYQDLSAPDAFFVLPLLLGAAYFLQQHMTPMMTTDPTQAKIMKFMPVMFTVFFLWFPAGLVLYSLVNALTSVIQQWYFIQKMERNAAANN